MSHLTRRKHRGWFAGIAVMALLIGGTALSISTKADVAETGSSESVGVVDVKAPVSKPAPPAAIASARGLSTAFRHASEMVLPSIVAIENKPKAVAMKPNMRMKEMAPFGDLDR